MLRAARFIIIYYYYLFVVMPAGLSPVICTSSTVFYCLTFIFSGELKLRVDPSHHPTQYPQHFPVGDIAELEKEKARELLRK